MSHLLITRREFQRAYRNHFRVYLQWVPSLRARQSQLLLLFYAAECGLKAIWLKEHRLEDSLADSTFRTFGHDINRLLRDLRTGLVVSMYTRTVPGNVREVRLEQLNQAWRYGCEVEDESAIERDLVAVCRWVGREL
ncbi:Hypothetical protein DEACI_3832 [Acididesulfobacillus acetoxydans]|uniref:HEPN domain-containing protein n=1 Tax=Acididesulfobacillus acetoxydans TaxID=1561005 RepID=A0A8S0W9Z7_9FIRM|nr:Hypothetical protein DEACI_3832 [Acididesulfobacillus acetoxydans]CEJ05891.1 Hypothetical protein DEACI_0311 [Acididesulfobacillus acetoxydans]